MIRILYPENRMVSEDTVIGWAMDDKMNARYDAGEFLNDEDGSQAAAAFAAMPRLSVEEAIEFLNDSGAVTFGR
jgi:hypothetical protein